MLARSTSYTTLGLEALPVDVEVDVTQGLPALRIVGLPDRAVKEARERVSSAIVNSQYHLLSKRVTVNLAPADVKKEGGAFDLAIALGILAASGHLDPARLASAVVVGELALDGSVRPIQGILVMAMGMRHRRPGRTQPRCLLVPSANAAEASVVGGIQVIPVASLGEAAEFLSGKRSIAPYPARTRTLLHELNRYEVDFADVKGQAHAKRALEVAVAGAHHVLLIGPPGSGKTMLAQRLPTIQPELSLEEALEAGTIHSVAGLLDGWALLRQRPFRAPHHTSSAIALIGGGSQPRPGEVSLAHHGVLFLDELAEFPRDVLEALRQPLEAGSVHVARARRSVRFPARFQLVAAMNPCPCGYLTDPRRRCRCSTTEVSRYLGKLSGPLLDRIDLHIEVPPVPIETLGAVPDAESSGAIKARIMRARRRQRHRLRHLRRTCNVQLRHRELRAVCPMSEAASALLHSALQELALSARAYDKILKIARTIADLAEQDVIEPEHLAEAIQYRSLDRNLWS